MLKFLSKLFLIALTFAISSCGSEGPQISSNDKPLETTVLISALTEYNNQLSSNSSRMGGLGWIAVAGADVYGAYKGAQAGAYLGAFLGPHGATVGGVIGGLLCGTSASYHSYKYMSRASDSDEMPTLRKKTLGVYTEVKPMPIVKNDDIQIVYSLRYDTIATKVAVLHNVILAEVQSGNIEYANINYSNLSKEELQIVSLPDFESAFNTIVPQAGNYRTFKVETEADQVMNLFMEAIDKAGNSLSEITTIINDYIQIIEKSKSLSDEQKDALYTAFTVAAYSYNYWSSYEEIQ
jgi:hypothetical protein